MCNVLGTWDIAMNKIDKNPFPWRADFQTRRDSQETITTTCSKSHSTFASEKWKRRREKKQGKGLRDGERACS